MLDRLIQCNICAPETINRLLWIAYDKQLAWHWPNAMPHSFCRVIGSQQHQYFRLQRIGVLELIHEYVGITALQLGTHDCVFSNQIARAEKQVEEVQTSSA